MSLLETLSLNCADLSARLAGARVLVVGDVMLDRYWFGEVNRISPEAPVPVAKITRIEERAGGRLFDQLAQPHEDHEVRQPPRLFDVVGDHDHGVVGAQRSKQILDAAR